MSPILTVKEACEFMKCGRKFLYDEIKAGRIRARICGHGYRLHRDDLERYVLRREGKNKRQRKEDHMICKYCTNEVTPDSRLAHMGVCTECMVEGNRLRGGDQ